MAALSDRGSLYCWGNNLMGQLGIAQRRLHLTAAESPTLVPFHMQVISVSAGKHHTAAILLDGTLHSWGCTTHVQLGIGTDKTKRPAPCEVDSMYHRGIRHLSVQVLLRGRVALQVVAARCCQRLLL